MVQNEIETDYTEEVRNGILDSTLQSTLQEYKKLDRMHQAILILVELLSPEQYLLYHDRTKYRVENS